MSISGGCGRMPRSISSTSKAKFDATFNFNSINALSDICGVKEHHTLTFSCQSEQSNWNIPMTLLLLGSAPPSSGRRAQTPDQEKDSARLVMCASGDIFANSFICRPIGSRGTLPATPSMCGQCPLERREFWPWNSSQQASS